MSTKTKHSDDGKFIVQEHAGILVRLLGLPFVIGGAYFLQILAASIYDYATYPASLSQWLEAIPGFIILILLAAIFGGPGLFICFGRQRIEFDIAKGRVIEKHRFFPWKSNQDRPLSEFSKITIELVKKETGSGAERKTSFFHEVGLEELSSTKDAPSRLNVATFGYEASEEELAKELAQKLSSLIGLEFEIIE